MMGRIAVAAVLAATTTPVLAQSGGWYVFHAGDRQCYVSNQIIPGMGKLGGPYDSRASATAAKERLAVCDKVNTDLSPGDSSGSR
jgi:hypothetical protein